MLLEKLTYTAVQIISLCSKRQALSLLICFILRELVRSAGMSVLLSLTKLLQFSFGLMMYESYADCKWRRLEVQWNSKETESARVPSSEETFSNFVQVELLYDFRCRSRMFRTKWCMYDTLWYKWAKISLNSLCGGWWLYHWVIWFRNAA
jgi:hypothetical protein